MKDISPILQSLGLLDSEIKTYLGVLTKGPSVVLDLSASTGLSRQATYTAIEALTERGLMSSVLRGKKRYYAAEPPDKLLSYAKRRESEMKTRIKDLQDVLPELKMQTGGERPVVRMFEGKEGLKAIVEDKKVTKHDTVREISDLEALYNVLKPEDLEAMRNELNRKKVKISGLYAGVPGKKVVSDTTRIFLPKELSGFASDIGVYGNKVSLTTFEGKMYSVIVESEPLTKALGILFDLAIKGAKDLPRN